MPPELAWGGLSPGLGLNMDAHILGFQLLSKTYTGPETFQVCHLGF